MGGLSAGCYGQMNGYGTQIFEIHTLPGGPCASWKRMGYAFDVCVHHLLGCSVSSKIYQLWHELGAMPCEMGGLRGGGGKRALPGLSNFYFVGVWASMSPSLFGNASSGRKTIQTLCKKDGKKFFALS